MSNLLKLEELALTGLAFFLALTLPFAWWWFWVLFLLPDVSMLGYLAGPRAGALTYNLVHHKALAVGLYLLGVSLQQPGLQLTGLILLGHSSLDRVMGYGLKYADAFAHTHLGMIGRGRPAAD